MFISQTHLLELGRDEITNGGEGELECKIIARRMNKPKDREVKTPPIMLREWAMWGGGNFTHIYTDGSFRKDENWGELLLELSSYQMDAPGSTGYMWT